MRELALIVAANLLAFVVLRLNGRRVRRAAALKRLKATACDWEQAGWVPLKFEQRQRSYAITFRWHKSEELEELVIDA